MTTITEYPAVDIPAPLLALLRTRAAEEIESVADGLCAGQEGLDQLVEGAPEAQARLSQMEDAIRDYRRIMSTAPYDLASVIALANSYIECEAGCDHDWPASIDEARDVLDHIEMIRQRDEWVRLEREVTA